MNNEISDHWKSAAQIRKDQVESGLDISFHEIFLPIFQKLVHAKQPSRVLDAGAGTGHLSKELSRIAKNILAIEPSPSMYTIAKSVLEATNVSIERKSSFDLKPSDNFDLIISHMCAHTVPNAERFISSLQSVLDDRGELVISIPHPCFYEGFKSYFGDEYSYMKEQEAKIDLNISLDSNRKMSNIPYYHRPLQYYFKCFENAGLSVNSFLEPWPTSKTLKKYPIEWKSPKYCFFFTTHRG